MDQITNIITTSAMSILVVLTGIVVQAVKKYLLMPEVMTLLRLPKTCASYLL